MKSEQKRETHIKQQSSQTQLNKTPLKNSKVTKVLQMKENSIASSKRSSLKNNIKPIVKSGNNLQGNKNHPNIKDNDSQSDLQTSQNMSYQIIDSSLDDDIKQIPKYTNEVEDKLKMALSINFYTRNVKMRVFEGFDQINFLKQHQKSHMSVMRADLRKRQVFFYWYSALPELKASNEELGQNGQILCSIFEKILKKQAFFDLSNQEQKSKTEIEIVEDYGRNQQMLKKVNSWLTNVPRKEEKTTQIIQSNTKSILKKKK